MTSCSPANTPGRSSRHMPRVWSTCWTTKASSWASQPTAGRARGGTHNLLPSHPAYPAVCELLEERAANWDEQGTDATVLRLPRRSFRRNGRQLGRRVWPIRPTADRERSAQGRGRLATSPHATPRLGSRWATWTLQGDASGWEVEVAVAAGVAPPDTRDPSRLRAVVFTRDETGRPGGARGHRA